MHLQLITQNILFYCDNLKILHEVVNSLVLSSVSQGSFWDPVLQFVEKHPVLFGLLGAVFGSILTLVGVFFRQIGRFIADLTKWLWIKIRGRGADYSFEKSYLDWLIGEHRYLDLLPARLVAQRWKDRQRFVDLENVYVGLSMSSQGGDEQWAETYGHGEDNWRKRLWIGLRFIRYLVQQDLLPRVLVKLIPSLTETEQMYQLGDLGLIIDRHKRLIIRGDPGSGKTTLLRYFAVTCARTLRNNKQDGDSREIVRKRLLWTERPFPILVRLRRHGNVTSWDEAKELTATMLEEMPPELRKRCPSGFFERRLLKGKCLILLDAFDELGNPEARAAMARKIAGFLEVYKRNDNRIVVTTRIVGYEGQLDRYDFAIRTVQNLKAGEVRALVKQRYSAITVSEIALRSDQEARDIKQKMLERAAQLIEKIEHTPRLNQLATNPMLLSLIVLVHSLKFELPEQRLLLYRDCVEILAERWQQFKQQEEVVIKKEDREELTLNQKLVLLRELAFAMQRQRKDEGSLALISKDAARDLIAQKLPDFLGVGSPQDDNASREIYCKAEEWIAGIQEESGILVEQGLAEAGEPLIGFSHLTFQEYLAAVAINEVKAYRPILRQNLLHPAWREVVLLYAALVDDATSIVNALLRSSQQPHGVLLAGNCLTERLKKVVKARTQQATLEKLKEGFSDADDDAVSDFGKVMGMLGGRELTTFMRQQLSNPSLKKRLAVVNALGQTRVDALELEQVRTDLVQIVETSSENEITVAVREALAQVGDPRFVGPEPILVRVPKQPNRIGIPMRIWKDFKVSPKWKMIKKFLLCFDVLRRVVDYWLFTMWCAIWRRQLQNHEFEISKYPITNIEYSRFVEATGYPTPSYWKEGTFPREEATHPVVGVISKDAKAYCKWLSHNTGNRYRLPTEWEWEWAAAGPNRWKYPWGDQFDKDRCNTKESGMEGTTPVGSYLAGNSLCGASDMSGNVWEITLGVVITIGRLIGVASLILLLRLFFVLFVPFPLLLSFRLAILSVFAFIQLSFLFALIVFITFILPKEYQGVLRGGAWNTPFDKATCFYRKNAKATSFAGFRCVKEIEPAE